MFEIKKSAELIQANLLNHEFAAEKLGPIQFDTRKLQKGECFIALNGEERDGHDFLEAAINQGATAALVNKSSFTALDEEIKNKILESAAVIATEDVELSIAKLALEWRRYLGVKIFAVTGSNGKTSTKDMLGAVMQKLLGDRRVFVAQGSFNNHIGVPRCISLFNEKTEAAILEYGTNHFGELAYLAKYSDPNAAMITNVGDSHLEFLGDRNGVLRAKRELLDGVCSDNQVWFINIDDPLLKDLATERAENRKIYCYSLKNQDVDFFVRILHKLGPEDNFGYLVEFSGNFIDKKIQTKIELPGEHNVQNALAAFAVATAYFSQDAEKVADALQKIPLSQNRSELIPLENGSYILNDCYNANPTSMEKALAMTAENSQSGFMVAVGDMKELGENASELHRELGAKIAKYGAESLACCGDYASFVAEGAKSAGLNDVAVESNPKELVDFVQNRLTKDKILLVKGSRGAKMEALIDSFTRKNND